MRLTVPIVLFVCAVFVRLLFNVFVTGMGDVGLDRFPDGKAYDALGLSLASGLGYEQDHTPDIFRPPGYPLFLAAVYALFGHSYASVKVLQSVLGALTCVMIMLLGERLFSRRVGVIAGTIAAVYPFLVVYTGFMLSEGLFIFLSVMFLYALVRLREALSLRWAATAGLVLGVMNLTRPVTLLLPALLFCWLWLEWGNKRRVAVIAAMLTIWMLVPILPWTVRNYLVTRSFIPIADHHWVALYAGNNDAILHDPDKIGGWIEPEKLNDYRSAYLAFIGHTLVHEPLEMLRLELYKLARFWSVMPTSSKTTSRDAMVSLFSYGLLLPLFVSGVILSLRMPQKPWLLYVWVLHFCLVTLIVYGSTRLRSPIEPALVLFAALALERVWLIVTGAPERVRLQRAASGYGGVSGLWQR